MSAPPPTKRCSVAWAGARQQYRWQLQLGATARIADALEAARAAAAGTPAAQAVPWDTAPVGVFGAPRQRTDDFADGDRIELYRPLAGDPRERRRAQVARERRAGGRR